MNTTPEKEEKEDDSHPYRRPKDAATLILVDRNGSVPEGARRQTA